jgi:hypothetical protein
MLMPLHPEGERQILQPSLIFTHLFYEEIERAYNACPGNDVKILMGEANVKIVRET